MSGTSIFVMTAMPALGIQKSEFNILKSYSEAWWKRDVHKDVFLKHVLRY